MMFWGVPAATVSPADLEPESVMVAPASTTTPAQFDPELKPWGPESSILVLSSTTIGTVEVSIEPKAPTNTVNGHERYFSGDDEAEEWPVATEARPKAVLRMKGRVVRVVRPRYEAAGLPAAEDILDDLE